MTVGDFVNLVKNMRDAQKKYFRTKSHSALILSMELEERVDLLLKERDERNMPKQAELGF